MRPRGPIDKADVVANTIMQLPNERVWPNVAQMQIAGSSSLLFQLSATASHSFIECLQSLSKLRPKLTNGQRGHDSNWLMATN